MAMNVDFLKSFDKEIGKIEGVSGLSSPPSNWVSFGNYVLNKIMSGVFRRGTPQGRITCVAGPSGSGKSFLVGNLIKNAQDAGHLCVVIDSENALDNDYMTAIGADVDSPMYKYYDVSTIAQVIKVISNFIKMYQKEYGTLADNPDQPPVFIAIDSLDMLATDTELTNFEKGDQKGDQGQRAKQLKAMLRSFVAGIKHLNIQMVVTHQVYRATQDQILAGEGLWKVGDAIRYACSQIVLVTRLKLKEDTVITGIRMKCEGFKTRFTRPFQTVTIEVPYSTGMDPASGLIESMEEIGVLKRGGSWYAIDGTDVKFQAKNLSEHIDTLLAVAESREDTFLKSMTADEDPEQGSTPATTKAARLANHLPSVVAE